MKGKRYRYDKKTGKMVEVVSENVLSIPEFPAEEKKKLTEWDRYLMSMYSIIKEQVHR
jgi:hypothetical protein